jgi:hypothetical protein
VIADRAVAVRRLLAFAADYIVIVAWGGVVFGAVMLMTAGQPPRPANPWIAQGVGLLTMTLPVTVYFSVCEASWLQASLGKRLLGLVVTRASGESLSFRAALLRNALKFVPWECGHLMAQQAIFSADAGIPVWAWAPGLVAFIVPAWWLLALFATGQTPYDRWSGTDVTLHHRAGAA